MCYESIVPTQNHSGTSTRRLRAAVQGRLGSRILRSWQLYVLLVPAFLFIILFRYGPMYGLQLAFKSFNIRLGISASPWIGFDHFVRLFSYYRIGEIFLNTLILAVYKLAACFPLPIILAIALNEVRNVRMRRTIQVVTYAPYFISVVIVVGMLMQIFSPHYGIYAVVCKLLGKDAMDKDTMAKDSMQKDETNK